MGSRTFSLGLLLLTLARVSFADLADEVAAYDSILATVPPGQTSIALGDMIVPAQTVQLWRNKLAGVRPPRNASQTGINKWTGGNVYYAFTTSGGGAVSPAHQTATTDAMAEWATFANLHFIPRTSEANYIQISDGGAGMSGGVSALGMAGGMQALTIGSSSWNRGTILHELGHALGLIHEHQRSDRDTFVTINFSNVPGGAGDANFIRIPTSTNNGTYDFLSVMHYPRKQSAVNPALDTITPKAGYTQFADVMGANLDRSLSRLDRDGMALASMYGAGPALSTIVTNTQDSGPGSLRTALYKAFDIVTDTPLATPVITFNIPGAGPFTIQPSDRLPSPGPNTTIDASAQTIVLNGSQQPPLNPFGIGLRLSAANVTVKKLIINGCPNNGIFITGGSTNTNVVGCYIGTNAAGTAAVPNAFAGIEITGGATGNRIGGTTAAERNVISGNTAQGVLIRGGATGNFVTGNYIGLNAAGAAALPNVFAGVEIGGAAQGNIVGGTTAGAGNLLSGNGTQGVKIGDAGTTGNVVAGNIIGLNATGTGAIPNTFSGVGIFSGATGNTIGGTAAGSLNIISGNAIQGIYIRDTGTNANTVAGNWIGLDVTGLAKIANATSGVEIGFGAANNVIGGNTAAARNVISGNTDRGVFLYITTGNRISGNYIGTNAAGTAAVGNLYTGVEIQSGATGTTVGGSEPGTGNVISGNVGRNVLIDFGGANNNTVAGNFIGLNAAGTAALVNGGPGIQIWGGAQGNTIGGTSGGRNFICGNNGEGLTISDSGTNANIVVGNSFGITPAGAIVANSGNGISIFGGPQNNIIGGSTPGAANLISGNGGSGISLYDATTTGTRINGNSIYANNGPGIDLGGFGVTANDANDADTGPNNFQNFPALTSAILGTGTTVAGTLNSNPSAGGITYRVEFFANPPGLPTGSDEGQTFVGSTSVTTNASGAGSFSTVLPAIVPANYLLTATATDPAGNTSEFSATRAVTITDSDTDGLPDAYELANWPLLTTTNGTTDSDGDGMTNAQEFRAGTNPRDPLSVFRLAPPVTVGADKTLSLANFAGRTYRIDYADDLLPANHWRILADQIPGTGMSITITDPGAASLRQRYYRAIVAP